MAELLPRAAAPFRPPTPPAVNEALTSPRPHPHRDWPSLGHSHHRMWPGGCEACHVVMRRASLMTADFQHLFSCAYEPFVYLLCRNIYSDKSFACFLIGFFVSLPLDPAFGSPLCPLESGRWATSCHHVRARQLALCWDLTSFPVEIYALGDLRP